MDFAHGVTITVRSTTTDTNDYGDSTTTVTESKWGPCAIAPRYATEGADPNSPRVIVGQTIYGPTRVIDSDDTLLIGGVEYQVDGLPGEWVSPFTGWAPGIEVPVKRTAAV